MSKVFYTMKELMKLPHTKIPFLWEGFIPQSGITFITGQSDSNKSTFLRQLSLAIAKGDNNLLGIPLNVRSKNVIYISTEDDEMSVTPLLKKQAGSNFPEAAEDSIAFMFEYKNHIQILEDFLKKNKVDLIIIDTWTDTMNGDLNQTLHVRANLDKYKTLATKHEIAFVMVHHQKKGTEDRISSKADMLGSQGIEAKSRAVIEIKRDGKQRVFKILKSNYASDAIKARKLVVELDENMLMHFVKEIDGFDFTKAETKESMNKKIMERLIELKPTNSYEKVYENLSTEFASDMVGITTLKNWYNNYLKENSDNDGVITITPKNQ